VITKAYLHFLKIRILAEDKNTLTSPRKLTSLSGAFILKKVTYADEILALPLLLCVVG
jgi:hypothetical protein